MKTTIVCGLLGSGKTTYIQNFLRQSTEKAVVLVNDFGIAGIDGEIFSESGIESVELPSGCVCCTLKSDLMTAIEKIRTAFAPAHLLIEPSGIASPSGVLEALALLGINPVTVVGIVDVTEFIDLYEAEMYGSFFREQVANSDIVLVNKTDLEEEEKITRTICLIGKINPGAITLSTINASFDRALATSSSGRRQIHGHSSHLHFDTASFVLKDVEFESLGKGFDAMSKGVYGNIVRAKSLVITDQGPFRFDLSYGKIDVVPLDSSPRENRLVVIGENLKKEDLSGEFS